MVQLDDINDIPDSFDLDTPDLLGTTTFSSVAWHAYQRYSQGAYGRNASLQKANMQRAYMQGVYAQRNAEAQGQPNKNETRPLTDSPATPQEATRSRYIPSTNNELHTYSRESLTRQQFDRVVKDDSQQNSQLLLHAMIAAAHAVR